MPRELSRSDLAAVVPSGGTVFVAGGTAAPAAILGAWREARALAGVTMVGVPIPGLNHLVPAELGDGCRLRTCFLAPSARAALAERRVELLPMHYGEFYNWLARPAAIDAAVFQVAPPDREGRCDLEPCTDLVPALLARRDVRLIAEVNGRLPRCRDGVSVPLERLDAVYRAETGLPEFTTAPGADADTIAAHAATLVEDGATVQIGIGRLPDQVLRRLSDRRRLKLHGGTVSAAGLALLDAGAADSIIAGVTLARISQRK